MKKLYLILLILIVRITHAQTVFWTENFITSTCGQATLANGYVTPNGTWTVASTGLNDPEANLFFISATENGNGAGNCGSGCGTNRTLHVGANDGFTATDGGASYNAGGLCGSFFCVTANWRAESPVIDCSPTTANITLEFDYMEFADGSIDDATLWYYDGSTWSQIDPLAKTTCCGGPCNGNRQGLWTHFTTLLPVNSIGNSNVKVGFNWTNNDDGVGTDPSFAVDNITLTSRLSASVGEINASSLRIYPNPAKDELSVYSDYRYGAYYVIKDITGRQVKKSGYILQENKINIADLNAGCYFIHLLNNENKIISSEKFIKQ